MSTVALQRSARPASVRSVEAASPAGFAPWDPLILSVALYVLTAIGRIHQLFGALEALHLAALAGVLAIGLYAIDGAVERRAGTVRGATPPLVAALLLWMMASAPFALNTGAAVDAVFNNLLKTAIMSFV